MYGVRARPVQGEAYFMHETIEQKIQSHAFKIILEIVCIESEQGQSRGRPTLCMIPFPFALTEMLLPK